MYFFVYRTQETTKSECVIPKEYTKFATLADAKAALLQLGHNKYAKVTKPKENLWSVSIYSVASATTGFVRRYTAEPFRAYEVF